MALSDTEANSATNCPAVRRKAGDRHFLPNLTAITANYGLDANTSRLRQSRVDDLRLNAVMLMDGGQTSGGNTRLSSKGMNWTFWYYDSSTGVPLANNNTPTPRLLNQEDKVDNRHSFNMKANYLFGDGHTQTLAPEAMTYADFRHWSKGRRIF